MDRLDNVIARVEQVLIAALLSLMIVIAFLQIVLRNVFSTGFLWGDPLVRYLVLWVGFIGASLAAKEGKHIAIEVLGRIVSDRVNRYIESFVHLASSVVCAVLVYAAVKFTVYEAEIGPVVFFGIRSWVLQLIIPIAMGLMTFRFGLEFIRSLKRPEADSDETSFDRTIPPT